MEDPTIPLEVKELTEKILADDKQAYVDEMANTGLETMTYVLLGLFVVAIILMIVCIVKGKKAKSSEVPKSSAASIICAVLSGFMAIIFLGAGLVSFVPKLFVKASLAPDPKVFEGEVLSKNEIEVKRGSTRKRYRTVMSKKSYQVMTKDGECFEMPKEVYDEIEIGETYYFACIGDYEKNCFNAYDTDEYHYEP